MFLEIFDIIIKKIISGKVVKAITNTHKIKHSISGSFWILLLLLWNKPNMLLFQQTDSSSWKRTIRERERCIKFHTWIPRTSPSRMTLSRELALHFIPISRHCSKKSQYLRKEESSAWGSSAITSNIQSIPRDQFKKPWKQ